MIDRTQGKRILDGAKRTLHFGKLFVLMHRLGRRDLGLVRLQQVFAFVLLLLRNVPDVQ